MAKKQKHPEHVNLERYLISYADFITLLFATFVVLYALSQVDIKDFKALETSIKQAFAAPSLTQGSDSVMPPGSDSLFDTSQGDSMIAPLMMEYMSQKYEDQSMDDIEKSIADKAKEGDIQGVEATQTDRGLLITFSDDLLFQPGSATLSAPAKKKLDKVGAVIARKFVLHNMRVEGHTDNQPIVSVVFPSNWELSSARASSIIRYLIGRFSFMPSLFTAVGFADTRPVADNKTPKNRAKNRRVELLILKNKFKSSESPTNSITSMSKEDQDKMQTKRMETINRIDGISKAAKQLSHGDRKAEQNAIILNQVYYNEERRLSTESKALDSKTREQMTGQGGWLKPPAKVSEIKVFQGK